MGRTDDQSKDSCCWMLIIVVMMLRWKASNKRAHTVTVVVLSAGCNYSFLIYSQIPQMGFNSKDQCPAHKRCDHFSFFCHIIWFFKTKRNMIIKNVFTFTTKVFSPMSQLKWRDYMVLRVYLVQNVSFHHNLSNPLQMKSSFVLLIYLSTKLSSLLINI